MFNNFPVLYLELHNPIQKDILAFPVLFPHWQLFRLFCRGGKDYPFLQEKATKPKYNELSGKGCLSFIMWKLLYYL